MPLEVKQLQEAYIHIKEDDKSEGSAFKAAFKPIAKALLPQNIVLGDDEDGKKKEGYINGIVTYLLEELENKGGLDEPARNEVLNKLCEELNKAFSKITLFVPDKFLKSGLQWFKEDPICEFRKRF